MVSLTELWLPILLAAVFVFLASWLFHMFLPHHRSDYAKVPREDEFMAAVGQFNIPAGDYSVPRPAGMKDMQSPEFQAKWKKGPVLWMTVLPRGQNFMGRSLAEWFVYCLVVSVFAAYICTRALQRGAPYLEVSRFASTMAFAAYGLALWQNSIWYRRKWSTSLKSNLDAIVYGFLTGGAIGWLWPR